MAKPPRSPAAELRLETTPIITVGTIPWVTPKDMKSWEIHGAQVNITEAGLESSAARLIPPNSVLIVVRSGVLKHTIPVALNRVPVAINQDMKALRCSGAFDPDFLARFIKAQSSEILQWVRATTADNFPIDMLKQLRVPVPPLTEQRRIAEVLDRAEALRSKRRAALAQIDALTQAIFFDLFGDPAMNPKGWQRVKLGDAVFSASDGPHVSPTYSDDGIPFISTRHVRAGEISWEDLKFISPEDAEIHWRKCKPEFGDILYTKGGTTGLAVAVTTNEPFALWVHVALLKPNPTKVDSTWLESMLNTEFCYRCHLGKAGEVLPDLIGASCV